MTYGIAFKSKPKGKNHAAAGVDDVPSLCGAAFYSSSNPKCVKVGKGPLPLPELLKSHTGWCSRCEASMRKQIESDTAYVGG